MLKRQMYGRAGSALLQKLEQSLGVDACLNLWQVKTSVMHLRRTEVVITVRYHFPRPLLPCRSPDAIMRINRDGCNTWSGDECCLALAHVTLDVPLQLALFVSRLLEASNLRVGLVGGSASSPSEVPG
jgi:hypothetical protein